MFEPSDSRPPAPRPPVSPPVPTPPVAAVPPAAASPTAASPAAVPPAAASPVVVPPAVAPPPVAQPAVVPAVVVSGVVSLADRVLPEALLDAMTVSCTGTDGDVVDALAAVSAVESRVAAHKAKLIAELIRRQQVVRPGGPEVDRVQCPGREQVAAALKISCRSAQIEVDHAQRLMAHPRTLSALSEGVMTTRAAKVMITQTLDLSDEQIGLVEADVLDYACAHTPAEVKRRITRALHTLLPAVQEAQHVAAAAGREVVMYPAEHGMAVLEALLPCHEANLVFGYLTRAADVLKTQDRDQLKEAGLPTNELASRGTYRADALVALVATQWLTPTHVQAHATNHHAARGIDHHTVDGTDHQALRGTDRHPAQAADHYTSQPAPTTSTQRQAAQVADRDNSHRRAAQDGHPPTQNDHNPAARNNHEFMAQNDNKPIAQSGHESAIRDDHEPVTEALTTPQNQKRDQQGSQDRDLGQKGNQNQDQPAIDGSVVIAGEAVVRDVISAGTIVNIVMDLPTALGLADNPGELRGYGPIPGTLARELATDASWRRWITDEHGALTAVGTTRYRPPDALRELVIARDQRCRFPGCHQPAQHCDLDHAMPYNHGGPTDASNLGALCRRHHRIKTTGDWNIADIAPDGTYTWSTPTGEHVRQELEPLLPTTPAIQWRNTNTSREREPNSAELDSQTRLKETGFPF